MESQISRFEHLLVTKKQRDYDADFLKSWDRIEFWDTLVIGEKRRHPRSFLVEEEDVLSYNLALRETHPLFVDPEYARRFAPQGTILVHPVFTTTIAFWFAQPETQGSWIRTPGARNPFQRIEYSERIRVGDRIAAIHENHDRFWRRGKAYMTTKLTLLDADEREKAVCYGTLILPETKLDVERFVTA